MIAITGGGTGGHLKIAKVIKDELNKNGIKPIYIGSTYGQDRDWFLNDSGFSEKFFFDSTGVVDKKGLNKLLSITNILKYSFEASKILKEYGVNKVFSVGGFSAAPGSFGAILSRCELYIHEQNAYIGNLNRILKPFSKRFFNTFLYNDPYPIDEEFFSKKRVRKELRTIIFLGGSQGAVKINEFAMMVADELISNGIKIIHQTGKIDFQRVKEFYESKKMDVEVFDFDTSIVDKIAQADFAVSRAGASTLFELSANLLPTLFVPYPYAANNHQYFNAKYLVDKKAAFLVTQDKLFTLDFMNFLKRVNLEEISLNLDKLDLYNSTSKIVEELL